MAIVPILELPHPMLRRRARKVRGIDRKVLEIANNMVETMHDAGGVGLAANQIGILQRIIVIQMMEEEEARVYINPEIIKREGEREVEEGCLSIPGYRGMIQRSVWVRFGALDHTSTVVKLKAEGLLSQALEHEVDHLNGILYIDHLKSHDDFYKIEPDDVSQDESEGEGSVENEVEVDQGLGTKDSEQSDGEGSAASLTVT
ncbi:MAG: peptide deformylase [SAR202 cluster bacterium]|nr:peptide deformylase [Chloroflexota bacterium]MDP6422426.1 peptide deformylase [SAR202 cluster bacterium]MQG57200.1 peptide deformylase [SAR202 cluster bacterium]MQG67467.1 peptide deformylase [SAR202 cluster bacterium]HAL48652.1 peptide deformylase [Dehalococcoidia bacterium]